MNKRMLQKMRISMRGNSIRQLQYSERLECGFFTVRLLENLYFLGGDQEEQGFIVNELKEEQRKKIARPGELAGKQAVH